MLEGLLLPAISFILGSGGIATVLAWLVARKKAPAEKDSIVVQSAETAALALQKSLAAETARADRETQRADRLQAEVERKDKRITLLETRLDAMQSTLDEMRRELESLRTDA